MVPAIQNYITQMLITECKPVTYLDLCDEFSINVNKAKNQMVDYYSTTKHETIQCIIICLLKNNTIQMITDPDNLPDRSEMLDFFIYAFNPLETIDLIKKERKHVTIKNPYVVHGELNGRPATSETPAKVISIPSHASTHTGNAHIPDEPLSTPASKRAKTYPEQVKSERPAKATKPAKDMGLKSTALLARMRKEREEKEAQRQDELKKRKEQNHIVMTQEKKKQMEQLASMFDEDEDEDIYMHAEKQDEDRIPIAIESVPSQDPAADASTGLAKAPITDTRTLEELLDTTADESLLELSQKSPQPERQPKTAPQEQETYIDDDGYMVTTRPIVEQQKPAKPAKPTKSAKPSARTPPAASDQPKKKQRTGQRTLESFFGARK